MSHNNKSLLQFISWFRSYFWSHGHLLGTPWSCLLYRIQSTSLNSDFVRFKSCSCIGITVSELDATFSLVCRSLVCNTACFISGNNLRVVLLTFSFNWFELFRLIAALGLQLATLAQVFSCEFCEISKNTIFTEHR